MEGSIKDVEARNLRALSLMAVLAMARAQNAALSAGKEPAWYEPATAARRAFCQDLEPAPAETEKQKGTGA